MKLNSDIRIITKRLILQPISEKYIDEINKNFTKEITTYMPYDPTGNREDTINFVSNSIENLNMQKEIVFVVLDSITRNFIGCCGIHNINSKSVEIGLWIKKESQSNGLGTEIVTNLVDFIEQNFSINHIIYPVDEQNIRSRKIPEKLGFEKFAYYTKPKNNTTILHTIEYRKYYNEVI
ncbi:GNAT family N-acetyltransferase [Chishuiella sp.]|uniref:GNAT family N-acetyltransferase n=1 Tax=Chishuiella sp. TaxID=1969467 RepID=UPI0028AA1211|nr:GNAT family N-acetyltransferase [Chishuiella sp.]